MSKKTGVVWWTDNLVNPAGIVFSIGNKTYDIYPGRVELIDFPSELGWWKNRMVVPDNAVKDILDAVITLRRGSNGLRKAVIWVIDNWQMVCDPFWDMRMPND